MKDTAGVQCIIEQYRCIVWLCEQGRSYLCLACKGQTPSYAPVFGTVVVLYAMCILATRFDTGNGVLLSAKRH
jgi:hypothetical protein